MVFRVTVKAADIFTVGQLDYSSFLGKDIQVAIYRPEAYFRKLLSGLRINPVGRWVLVRSPKKVQNDLTLFRHSPCLTFQAHRPPGLLRRPTCPRWSKRSEPTFRAQRYPSYPSYPSSLIVPDSPDQIKYPASRRRNSPQKSRTHWYTLSLITRRPRATDTDTRVYQT